MHIINYDSKKISATITCKDDSINKELFESMMKVLLQHATAHLGTHSIPELFNTIVDMRTDFLRDVLIEIADAYQSMGGEISKEISNQIVGDRKIDLYEDEYDEEEKAPWE